MRKWRGGIGEDWQALLTRESYGLHFSVSARGRKPTDAEVDRAFATYKFGLWVDEHMEEVTTWWIATGRSLNPYVRHFVPDSEFHRIGAEKAARTKSE